MQIFENGKLCFYSFMENCDAPKKSRAKNFDHSTA